MNMYDLAGGMMHLALSDRQVRPFWGGCLEPNLARGAP